MSKGWARGSTRAWRRTRATVLARDRYTCRIQVPGTWVVRGGGVGVCLGVGDCVHHVHGKGRCEGCAADRLDHLVAACTPCNLHVGDPGKGTDPPNSAITKW